MIVATLGEKGGTGKTTLATNLAGMRAAESDVVLVDSDRQGTASRWVDARQMSGNGYVVPACIQSFGRSLQAAIREMSRRYRDVVVDVASGDNLEMAIALASADMVVIPVQPSAYDLWTMGQIDVRIEEARSLNSDLKAFVILNRTSTHPRVRDAALAREALVASTTELVLADVTLGERASIKRSGQRGLTVVEYRPQDARACSEIQSIYELVYGTTSSKDSDNDQ